MKIVSLVVLEFVKFCYYTVKDLKPKEIKTPVIAHWMLKSIL